MIERYSDHAANERTFLAWVRTAMAIIAFGFLVEKFDLFLATAGREIAGKPVRVPSIAGQTVGNIAGLALLALGCATLVLAIVRFRKTARAIDSPEARPDTGARLDFTLAGLLVMLAAVIFIYLAYTTLNRL